MKDHQTMINKEFTRYVVNGLFATVVHFIVFQFSFVVIGIQSAGLSNMFGAIFGIASSFLGSKYFVFPHCSGRWEHELTKFILLYSTVAVSHGAILFAWTDVGKLDPMAGFGVATIFQLMCTFIGNKYLVFNQ